MRAGLCAVALAVGLAAPALAQQMTEIGIVIRGHRFEPAELHVPSGRPLLLTVRNEDGTAEEFESTALKVEKVVAAGQTITVRLRPLAPGRFPFFGEFHPDTAKGVLVAE